MATESKRARTARMHREYAALCELIPVVECQLDFGSPFQLLVATVLSAQTTDKRVNQVTPELFAAYGTPQELAAANITDVERIIRPLGFYRMKSKHIIELAQALVATNNGQVAESMDALTALPGVGRKTANVVLGNAFGEPSFPVDTHVIRVTARLHWRDDWMKPNASPTDIEREITACFPPDTWTDLSHRLIIFGRNICMARGPTAHAARCGAAARAPRTFWNSKPNARPWPCANAAGRARQAAGPARLGDHDRLQPFICPPMDRLHRGARRACARRGWRVPAAAPARRLAVRRPPGRAHHRRLA
ncbi:EndoIII-related endonuclease [Bifidobacterium pseudolongum subsp. pseudolongum]|nr:EndoIII-related endonuclease [Bifidobacterium pseudolongum subsp. pseudolongum]